VKRIRIPDNLTTLAYKAIKAHIWEGHLDEDGRLTEERLSTMLGISKSPIREALNRLETEGLIRIEPRRGAYLRTFSVAEIDNLYDIREVLEAHVVATVNVTSELIQRLRESVERLSAYSAASDKFRYLDETLNFHKILAKGTGNEQLAKIIGELCQQVWLFRRRTYDVTRSHALDFHAAIVTALSRMDKAEAQRLMREHMAEVRGRLEEQVQSAAAVDGTQPASAMSRSGQSGRPRVASARLRE